MERILQKQMREGLRSLVNEEFAKHEINIEYPEWGQNPKIDPAVFGKYEDQAREALDAIEEVYTYPFISDSFLNHQERRAWRKKLSDDERFVSMREEHPRKVVEKNLFRMNILTPVHSDLTMLARYIGENGHTSLQEEIQQILSEIKLDSEEYAAMSIDEKKKTVIAYLEAVKECLIKISQL